MPKINELDQPTVDALRTVARVPQVEDRAAALEGRVGAVELNQSSGYVAYATKAALDADLSRPDGAVALVTNDPTTANN